MVCTTVTEGFQNRYFNILEFAMDVHALSVLTAFIYLLKITHYLIKNE